MMAKEFMVRPAFEELERRYGSDLLVVAYMNTSGRLKALAGRTGGAVCTSSNAAKILRWARERDRKIFFLPDRHLGENAAAQVGIPPDQIYLWKGGHEGGDVRLDDLPRHELERLDRANLVVWGSFCGVHTFFQPEHVRYWKEQGYEVVVHPECPKEVVDLADGFGSTSILWNRVMKAARGSRIAVGTEGHFVRNLREQAALRGIEVVSVGEVPGPDLDRFGCGCATMSRNDPPHLAAILDLLRKGSVPDLNRVLPGDVVDEVTGWRERLGPEAQQELARDARRALERMIELTEAGS
jgi:quinolinate synthase